ncbi:SDR family NAD(P)-dependent oxidoreductase [Kibdelosporangium philippinense]|uniref:SDR family NAD(P)-dependent oxidoreductase n=1 Tax=Kibdelosporangium philippinense TaxID=211113 RepID=A0ABS8ZLY3_9PSEU|nr:SDR family NAD(P)-dependent oxidoreductase [Kibdelosporangium philippinense]MCE7008173.1 SDR family NAD(P)-dependent oxidoreductase [Kibdelosporangium philippinense]
MDDMVAALNGKVAFVTGAASGIGRACARVLAAEGATVAIADIRTDRLHALHDELAETGAKVQIVTLDVTDEQADKAAIQSTVEQFGRLDVLVNCAGYMLLAPVIEADTADWTKMINTNVLGMMYLTHAALPHLIESKGSIVQMSSIAARTVVKTASAYHASKFAVNGFSEGLRQEVTELGVRVIVIEPGTTQTELRDHITHAASKAAIEARVAQYRQLQAEDVAEAVRYAVTAPEHVAVNEILIRPTDQI